MLRYVAGVSIVLFLSSATWADGVRYSRVEVYFPATKARVVKDGVAPGQRIVVTEEGAYGLKSAAAGQLPLTGP
jgi:hypothetical protein